MVLKKYKPYTPSRRFMVGYDFSDITKTSPEKSLTTFLWRTGGRNNMWRVTSRWIGGWHKRLYRMIDFRWYDKSNIPAKVASIEYDPYRTSRIALLNYVDGEKRYVLAWKGISVGDDVMCGDQAPIASWNRKQLKDIPEGMTVYNVEVTPYSTGKIVKSAGTSALISGRVVFLKMPSGEVRKYNENCFATIWIVSNEQHKNVVIGKAWRVRWMWRKPRVLWKNMNPVDHPHGGWEAHSPIWSKKWQKSFSGKRVSAGMKTRKWTKWSTKFIVSGRKKK